MGTGSSSQGGLSSSLSTASISPSGAGKNNQEMTSWLHHFLDFKARKAPGDICPCLYVAGHVKPQHCSEATVLERPNYGQWQSSPRSRESDPNGCPERAQPGKCILCPRGSWQWVWSIPHASQPVTCLFPCSAGTSKVGTVTVTLHAPDIRKQVGKCNQKR